MEHWGSNANDERPEHGAVVDTDDAGHDRAGPIRRLWSRLIGRVPAAEQTAEGWQWLSSGRPDDEVGQPSVAAPRATTVQAISHVAQATGGPFVETRLTREMRRLVASLGASRADVAVTLERHGVRAHPHERGPVAYFLEAVIGADPDVKSVAVDGESVVAELRAWWRSTTVVPLPAVVGEFTAAFDAGCYPRLVSDVPYRASREEPSRPDDPPPVVDAERDGE